MPLELREVKSNDEWNELIQCECESYEDPFNPFYILLRPNRGKSQEAREGFKELRDRQLAWHKHDPTSRWFKVVDTDIGDKVIGGANWNTFMENPYPQPIDHPLEGTWWPEGANNCPNGLINAANAGGRRAERICEQDSRRLAAAPVP
jgi:hypothetical protein